MKQLRLFLANIGRAIRFLATGQFRRVWNEVHVRAYRFAFEVIWVFVWRRRASSRSIPRADILVETEHPIAFESPDHIAPKGTAENNSTNKKFILHMDEILGDELNRRPLTCLDLGCSGGQMVKDFLDLRWIAVGLEGSDYSLKHRRANWAKLANTNLFTCDITKPFVVFIDGKPAQFDLITAWEVMEHIATADLDTVFNNIRSHLVEGGYFVASTTHLPDIHDGIELHQTKWEYHEWRAFIESRYPDLEIATLGLRIYQYVRYSFLHPSHLVYRKRLKPSVKAR